METRNVFEALQLAVSPVILISAYGLLLLSMTNRLGRAIDRARQLVLEGSAKEEQIAIIARRALWIRRAALLVLVLFGSVHLPVNVGPAVSVLFIGSLVCLVVGLIYFLVDIFASLQAMEAELLDVSSRRDQEAR